MSREEIQKLLGGYATDTLGEAERRALFEAALEDQELFDALAKEQALREVLQDAPARQQLLAALGPEQESFGARWLQWMGRPAAWAFAGGLATMLIVGGLALRQSQQRMAAPTIVGDAIEPSAQPALPRAMQPPAPVRRLKKITPLPVPPAITERQEVASANIPAGTVSPMAAPVAAPAPRPALVSGLAGGLATTEQTAPERFSVRDGARLGSSKKSKAMARFAAAGPAVAYTLLRRDATGAYSPVPAGTIFHAGDSVRLQVQPGEDGSLKLFQKDANAGWNLVLGESVEKAGRYVLPSTGGFESDGPARMEFMLVLTGSADAAARAGVNALASPAARKPVTVPIVIEYH